MQIPKALIGCEVWRVLFDYQTTLLLVDQNPDGSKRVWAYLIIETPFVLHDAAGNCHELDPNTSRSALAPVIDLLFKSITGVTVTDRGTLTLDFDDGAQLTVSPDPQYESWELGGEGISGILVGPGGEAGCAARVNAPMPSSSPGASCGSSAAAPGAPASWPRQSTSFRPVKPEDERAHRIRWTCWLMSVSDPVA